MESRWPGEEILDTDTRVREVTGSSLLLCSSAERLTQGQRKPSLQSGWSLPLRTSSACTGSPQLHRSITGSCSVRASLERRHFSPSSFSAHNPVRGCMLSKYGHHAWAMGSSSSPRELPLPHHPVLKNKEVLEADPVLFYSVTPFSS